MPVTQLKMELNESELLRLLTLNKGPAEARRRKRLTVVAVDPGKRVGVVELNLGKKSSQAYVVQDEDDYLPRRLRQLAKERGAENLVLVVEAFRLFPGTKGTGQAGSRMQAPEIIGVLRNELKRIESKWQEVTYKEQPPGTGKSFFSTAYMKQYLNPKFIGKGSRHAYSAFYHAAYWLVFS